MRREKRKVEILEEEVYVEVIEFTVAQRCEETENIRVDYIRIMDRG